MNITAVVPVHGREPLLKYTIGRLARQVNTICIGHYESECAICEEAGATFFYMPPGTSLGRKWQSAVDEARMIDTDVILVMGSASMISDNWIDEMVPHLENYDMVGAAGIHYYYITHNVRKLCYWSGYKGGRSHEPIGVGRLIRKSFLDKANWQIFDVKANHSLDYSTMQKLQYYHGSIGVIQHNAHSVHISTDKWPNKNGYVKMAHRSKQLAIDALDSIFPELKDIQL